MTNTILRDIINKFPEIIETGVLVIRSDNCSSQYKSQYVFQNLLDLSKKFNIQLVWFYGEAGYGRGLIDAMAWFGCKGPLRHAVIAHDQWFPTASSMVSYLSNYFYEKNDKSKFHSLITADIHSKELAIQ